MKIKSNVRAGKGTKSSLANNVVISYVPPVSRCVGI